MRKIPPGAEASSILVGQVDFLERPVSAFVRLSHAVFLSDLTEVPIPSRFIFVLLGPTVRTPKIDCMYSMSSKLGDDKLNLFLYRD